MEKCSFDKNNLKKVLRGGRNAVECTSIGGEADKNLLNNKDLVEWLRLFTRFEFEDWF